MGSQSDHSIMKDCEISGCYFTESILNNAIFEGCIISDVEFIEVDFFGTKFNRLQSDLSYNIFKDPGYDKETLWPKDFDIEYEMDKTKQY